MPRSNGQVHSSQLLLTAQHRAASQSEQCSATPGHDTRDLFGDQVSATGGNQPVPNHCKHFIVPAFNKHELHILQKIQKDDTLNTSKETPHPPKLTIQLCQISEPAQQHFT